MPVMDMVKRIETLHGPFERRDIVTGLEAAQESNRSLLVGNFIGNMQWRPDEWNDATLVNGFGEPFPFRLNVTEEEIEEYDDDRGRSDWSLRPVFRLEGDYGPVRQNWDMERGQCSLCNWQTCHSEALCKKLFEMGSGTQW
jgi:hypothetical protein